VCSTAHEILSPSRHNTMNIPNLSIIATNDTCWLQDSWQWH
jgi:hypothetical protein